MTFKDVVIKNFFGNVKQYLAFFLCDTFSIMLFFMYCTLMYNKALTTQEMADFFQYVIPVTMVGISVFSVFFIIYANTAFVRGRNKEFGLYLSLGMNHRELKRFFTMENVIISGVSLVAGIAIGALFSRLFQMVIINMLQLENVSYHLDYKSFVTTILAFVLIFSIVFLRTGRKMDQMDISSLLKESRQSEKDTNAKRIRIGGMIGILGMAASAAVLLFISSKESLVSNPAVILFYLALLFGSMYLTISKGGQWWLEIRKNRTAYQPGMVTFSLMEHKYKQNKRIIFVLSVLSTVTIFLVASPFSLLSVTENIVNMNRNDVEYISVGEENEQLTPILNKRPVAENKQVSFVWMGSTESSKELSECYPVISAKEYEKYTGVAVDLEEGECINNVLNWMPGDAGISKGSTLTVYGDQKYTFTVKEASHGEKFVSESFPSPLQLIVSDQAFSQLVKENQGRIGSYHMLKYENRKDTKELVEELTKAQGQQSGVVSSKIAQYIDLKNGYATFLFVTTVLGVLFFVAGGSVLYFRQFIELPQAKRIFDQLYKIGITKKEVAGMVRKELGIIFYLPIVFGIFAGVSIIYFMTNLVGGADVLEAFMWNTVKVVLVYAICQSLFYLITRRKYLQEIRPDR